MRSTPVTSGTLVVLQVGTKLGGTIVAAQSSGKFKGKALLELVIDSVSISGTRFPVQTNEIENVGQSRRKRTAVGAGGGAAFGAIIGAVAGGGKGAAIGALAGGGAGTAGAAFSSAQKTSYYPPRPGCISNWLSRSRSRLPTHRRPLLRQPQISIPSDIAGSKRQTLRHTATPSRSGTITGNNSLER